MDASNTNIASLHQFCSSSCSKAFSKTLCHTDSSLYGEHPKSFPKLESPFLIRSANHVLSRHVPSLLDLFTPKPLRYLLCTFFSYLFLAFIRSIRSGSFGHPRILVPKKTTKPRWPKLWVPTWSKRRPKLVFDVFGAEISMTRDPERFSVLAPQVLPSFEAFLQDTQLEVRRYLGPKICGSRGSPKKVHSETAAAWWKVRMAAIKTAGDPSQRQVVAESPGQLG